MIYQRTFDYALIRSILTLPCFYKFITDDFSVPVEQFQPAEHESIWYVLAFEGDELRGLFAFEPENTICWKIHVCLLPRCWGAKGREALQGVFEWIWENTPCLRIVGHVPSYNRLALKLALECGMILYGLNYKSIMKYGKLHDQVLVGISKPNTD